MSKTILLFIMLPQFVFAQLEGELVVTSLEKIEGGKFRLSLENSSSFGNGALSYFLYIDDLELDNPKIRNNDEGGSISFLITMDQFDKLKKKSIVFLSYGRISDRSLLKIKKCKRKRESEKLPNNTVMASNLFSKALLQ